MAQLNIDVTGVKPQEGMDPVPAGWYNVRMTDSEVKPTKTSGGFLLACKYAILDGQYANRSLFSRHNIKNDNPKAQEIAYAELSAIGHAVGVLMIQDSQQLHDKPMKVKVSLRPADGQYEASNDLKQWKNINAVVGVEASAGSAGFPAAAGFAPPQAPPASDTPWAPAQAAPAPVAPPWQPHAAPAPIAPAGTPPVWQPPAGGQPWAPAQAPVAPAPPVQAPAAPQAPIAPPWSAPAPAGAVAPPWATAPAQ